MEVLFIIFVLFVLFGGKKSNSNIDSSSLDNDRFGSWGDRDSL